MKRTFHIAPDAVDKDDVLLCEFSQHHVCIARADAASKKLKGLSYYELRNLLEPEKLLDVLKAENAEAPNRMVVSSAFKNVVIMPASQFTEDGARRIFSATYNTPGGILFFNELPTYGAVLIHAIPQGLMSLLKSTDAGEATHLLGCALQAGEASLTEQAIFVHFTNKHVHITAIKEKQLQIAQTYFYTAPLDVVYYLLLLCRQYGFSQEAISLILSGFVSGDSAMFKELYSYFSNIRFWEPDEKTMLQSEYQPHFFSSMYNLAACAL